MTIYYSLELVVDCC